ncbi:MAG TPA: hypothetical protein ENK19_12035 [Acidobacteria bacterium]|nr:hypothetical protein [Acidobacteriota bacterium]
MLDRAALRNLRRLTDNEDNTLTLYLDIDQTKQANRNGGYLVQAEAMLKELRSTSGDDAALQADATRTLELVRRLEPRGKTALTVVQSGHGVGEVHQIRVAIAPSVHWRRGAFLRPVVEALDEYERYAVVLTDKQRARIFTSYLGELVEHTDLISATGGKTQTTGTDRWWSQKRFQRHHEQKVALHAKRVVDALHELSLKVPFDRLIVAGPQEAAAQVARLLPRRLHGKLVKTIPLPVTASEREVSERIAQVQEEMERQQELEMVRGLLAELHESGRAVAGLENVVDAVNEGRVWKLFYVKGLDLNGKVCAACGSLAVNGERCHYCDGALHDEAHLVDRLSQSVIELAGRVEMVDGPAAEELRPAGSIAALLRY